QKMRDGPTQFSGRIDLNRSALVHERVGQGRELLHVGTKYDRFAGQDRFGWILAASREQTFPDEGNCGHAVPIAQLTGGIDNQTIKKWIRNRQLTSKRNTEFHSFQVALNFSSPF